MTRRGFFFLSSFGDLGKNSEAVPATACLWAVVLAALGVNTCTHIVSSGKAPRLADVGVCTVGTPILLFSHSVRSTGLTFMTRRVCTFFFWCSWPLCCTVVAVYCRCRNLPIESCCSWSLLWENVGAKAMNGKHARRRTAAACCGAAGFGAVVVLM